MDFDTIVVKVKYGGMLRRFNAQVVDEKLNLNIDGLKKKILSLFSFAPDTELMLTYIDEDGDVVALVDDDDLRDVVRQDLNPLRITVKWNAEKNGRHSNLSSGSSTPLRLPPVQQPLQNLNASVSEILRSVPEPLHETLVKLLADLASRASSSAPGVTELVDSLSKVGLSWLGRLPEVQPMVNSSMQGGVSESSTLEDPSNVRSKLAPTNDDNLEKLKPEATVKSNEVKINNATGGSTVGSAVAGNIASGKEVNNSEIKLGSKPTDVNAFDHLKGACADNQTRSVARDDFANPPGSIWTASSGSFYLPGSLHGPSPLYECPFSGVPVGDVSAALPHPTSETVPLNVGSGNIFHRGVQCDGCGVHPITGLRFKSKVKVDYDLCSICFEKMGNDTDYIRIDRPVIYRPHMMHIKGLHDARTRDRCPLLPQVHKGFKVKQGAAKLDSRFIQDVNIIDGTFMAPSTPFTKIWRMRNNGTFPWPQNTQLVWIAGDKLSNVLSVDVEIPAAGLLTDQELDVAVDFISPELPGRYVSYWRLASPSGQKFGQRVWVLIQVDASIKEAPRRNIRNLNLNLPPVSSCLSGPEIINVDPEPPLKNSHPEPDNSNKMVELVQPVINLQPITEQELKFPINDSLLVGNGASSSFPSAASVTYPIIDLSDVAPALPSVPPVSYPLPRPTSSAASAHQSGVDLPGQKQMEDKLLSDLNDMGFKQVDLNKEVLRMNEYDLEKAVDDLCGFPEWDPILEELQEMGFNDTEVNKMLLKKNNGSIKRVVMDLIAGEEN